MYRIVIATALLLGAGSIAGTPATSVVGKPLASAPQSRVQARADIDDATAAALIGAISSQFEERAVQVRLGQVDIAPAGIVQRDVRGTGELQIGRNPLWIPFRFRALYDTEQTSVGSPELTLGSDQPARLLKRDDYVAKALGVEAGRRLRSEFAEQATTLQLVEVRSAPAGAGLVNLEGRGVAMLGGDQATTRIHALYDPRTHEWLQLAYELGEADAGAGQDVATR